MKFNAVVLVCALAAGSSVAFADSIYYSFQPELTNSSTGADFLVAIGFYADPWLATTATGPNSVGEIYSVPVDSLAVTVFDLGNTTTIGSLTYGKSDLQNAGRIYFYPYDPISPQSASADPVLTLSAQNPNGSNFITLLLNGSSSELFASTTLGNTSGPPIASGPGLSSVPEPAALPLALIGGAALLFAKKRRRLRP
jgi:hypothetical protein